MSERKHANLDIFLFYASPLVVFIMAMFFGEIFAVTVGIIAIVAGFGLVTVCSLAIIVAVYDSLTTFIQKIKQKDDDK